METNFCTKFVFVALFLFSSFLNGFCSPVESEVTLKDGTLLKMIVHDPVTPPPPRVDSAKQEGEDDGNGKTAGGNSDQQDVIIHEMIHPPPPVIASMTGNDDSHETNASRGDNGEGSQDVIVHEAIYAPPPVVSDKRGDGDEANGEDKSNGGETRTSDPRIEGGVVKREAETSPPRSDDANLANNMNIITERVQGQPLSTHSEGELKDDADHSEESSWNIAVKNESAGNSQPSTRVGGIDNVNPVENTSAVQIRSDNNSSGVQIVGVGEDKITALSSYISGSRVNEEAAPKISATASDNPEIPAEDNLQRGNPADANANPEAPTDNDRSRIPADANANPETQTNDNDRGQIPADTNANPDNPTDNDRGRILVDANANSEAQTDDNDRGRVPADAIPEAQTDDNHQLENKPANADAEESSRQSLTLTDDEFEGQRNEIDDDDKFARKSDEHSTEKEDETDEDDDEDDDDEGVGFNEDDGKGGFAERERPKFDPEPLDEDEPAEKEVEDLNADNNAESRSGKPLRSGDMSRMITEEEDASSTHFMSYFLVAVMFVACFYIIFHNRQKIKAYVIEGRHSQRGKRQKSAECGYHSLSTEDVLISSDKATEAKINYAY